MQSNHHFLLAIESDFGIGGVDNGDGDILEEVAAPNGLALFLEVVEGGEKIDRQSSMCHVVYVDYRRGGNGKISLLRMQISPFLVICATPLIAKLTLIQLEELFRSAARLIFAIWR